MRAHPRPLSGENQVVTAGSDASDLGLDEGKCQDAAAAGSAASLVPPEDLLVAAGVFNERCIFVENNVVCNCL